MRQSSMQLQAKLIKEYYKDFSKYAKGRLPENKVAWVTAFTPVEILEALNISYYYPESYAAVIAASGKERELLDECESSCLSRDCCTYSCCMEGCLELEKGPRGIPPKPDVLIATNNQCNTLPTWWNILAERYQVPLIVLDYPGEMTDREIALEYVTQQHKELIIQMEELSGTKLDICRLQELIENSRKSVGAWNNVIARFSEYDTKPTLFFDAISFLITSRCKPETNELYCIMEQELQELPKADTSLIPLFWLGYPLWYHQDRYLSELLEGFRVVGSNYITWWSLDYSGEDVFEKLFSAYNFTFLNLSQESRNHKLNKNIEESGAICTVTLHNKSCKCDFVSARDIGITQAELEIDMIDRGFLDVEKARNRIELLREMVCVR